MIVVIAGGAPSTAGRRATSPGSSPGPCYICVLIAMISMIIVISRYYDYY